MTVLTVATATKGPSLAQAHQAILAIILSLGILAPLPLQAQTLPDFDPSGLFRFDTADSAKQTRKKLIEFIWPAGLPLDATPTLTPSPAPPGANVPADWQGTTLRLDIPVATFKYTAIGYRWKPDTISPATWQVILHAGHVPEGEQHLFDGRLDATLQHLLKQGCDVTVLQMPFCGWNRDQSLTVADQAPVVINHRSVAGHRELFAQLEAQLSGEVLRPFLEPVVQVTNLYEQEAQTQKTRGIAMIGLSGGGWTTHMSAALDTRIKRSIPVAGAMPMYARALSPGSTGDSEQTYPEIFAETDSDADGVPDTAAGLCSWLEVFALGALGSPQQPRRQIQVLNFYDSCCFSGDVYESYSDFLGSRVSDIGDGHWDVYVDRTHRGHLISDEVLRQVVDVELD